MQVAAVADLSWIIIPSCNICIVHVYVYTHIGFLISGVR